MQVQGIFKSVVRGVSQQAPADRIEGQHGEVVNMISDPVRGLVRRNGMILESSTESHLTGVPQGDIDNAVDDGMSFRVYSYRIAGIDYDLVYRSRKIEGENSLAHILGMNLYKREYDKEKFLTVAGGTQDSAIWDYLNGGLSAVTNVGDYLIMAGNGILPEQTVVPRWGTPANLHRAAIWVRGGSYARTYTVRAVRTSDQKKFVVSYKTPSSTYPGKLDFTGVTIDPATPEYQKEVNDIQAAYDTAVNQHISAAAAAILPASIAEHLHDLLIKAGWTGALYWEQVGSTLLSSDVASLEVDDGSNGDFMRATLSDEASVDQLPSVAHYGKVVRITPPGADPFYMEAFQTSDTDPGVTPWGRVMWREAAGEQQVPSYIFSLGLVYKDVLYIATTPEKLQETILEYTTEVVDVPKFLPSTAGDTTTAPPPAFFGRQITMLSMFQDRLLIGSGGTVTMSQRGDYYNFYRTTVVTLPDSDPVEVFAAGSEDDTIRKTTLHEMNLFIHGDRRHYMIPGRSPIGPSSASMGVMWEVDSSAWAQPVSNGANLFIVKDELQVGATRLLQVQPGLYQDIPQLQDVSQQLRDYINGFPAEIVAFLNPGAVFVRTEFVRKSRYGFPRSRKQGLYMYQYTDQGDQRLIDAWSSWEWSEHIGRPIGIAPAGFGDTLRIYTLVHGVNASGLPTRAINVLRASIRPDPTGLPYLDALRVGGTAELVGMYSPAARPEVRAQVYTSPGATFSYEDPLNGHNPDVVLPNGPHFTVGDTNPTVIDPVRWEGVNGWLYDFNSTFGPFSEERKATIYTGLEFFAYAEITNPFVRDQEGKADTWGALKLARLHVITTRTAGMQSSWKDLDGQEYVTQYKGNYEQINYKHNVFVGRDTRYVQIRLAADRWLPLTINGITWKGSWFGERKQ